MLFFPTVCFVNSPENFVVFMFLKNTRREDERERGVKKAPVTFQRIEGCLLMMRNSNRTTREYTLYTVNYVIKKIKGGESTTEERASL